MSDQKPVSRSRCLHCNKKRADMKCGKCEAAFYCREECQKLDLPKHKTLCRVPLPDKVAPSPRHNASVARPVDVELLAIVTEAHKLHPASATIPPDAIDALQANISAFGAKEADASAPSAVNDAQHSALSVLCRWAPVPTAVLQTVIKHSKKLDWTGLLKEENGTCRSPIAHLLLNRDHGALKLVLASSAQAARDPCVIVTRRDVTETDSGTAEQVLYPLHVLASLACSSPQFMSDWLACLSVLLDAGADVNVQCWPLGHSPLLEALTAAGSNPKSQEAVFPFIEALVAGGARAGTRSHLGNKRPLDVAGMLGHGRAFKVLASHTDSRPMPVLGPSGTGGHAIPGLVPGPYTAMPVVPAPASAPVAGTGPAVGPEPPGLPPPVAPAPPVPAGLPPAPAAAAVPAAPSAAVGSGVVALQAPGLPPPVLPASGLPLPPLPPGPPPGLPPALATNLPAAPPAGSAPPPGPATAASPGRPTGTGPAPPAGPAGAGPSPARPGVSTSPTSGAGAPAAAAHPVLPARHTEHYLQVAAQRDHADILKLASGVCKLELNHWRSPDHEGMTLLMEAIRHGAAKAVEALLAVPGIEVNATARLRCDARISIGFSRALEMVLRPLSDDEQLKLEAKQSLPVTALDIAMEKAYCTVGAVRDGVPAIAATDAEKTKLRSLLTAAGAKSSSELPDTKDEVAAFTERQTALHAEWKNICKAVAIAGASMLAGTFSTAAAGASGRPALAVTVPSELRAKVANFLHTHFDIGL